MPYTMQDDVRTSAGVLPIEGEPARCLQYVATGHCPDVFRITQEEDYVTEKYAQALVAGSVPIVIGATNIEHYAAAPNSMLVLQTKEVGFMHFHAGYSKRASIAG